MTAWLLLAASLLLILACGVFVAAEFSFVTVDRSKVEQAADAGDKGARACCGAAHAVDPALRGPGRHHDHQPGDRLPGRAGDRRPHRGPLRTAGLPDGRDPPVAVGIGLVIGSAVTMIFGELVPKNLAIAQPMQVARATQRFQRIFTAVALPSGCSTARPTRSCGASGWSPRRSCGRRAPRPSWPP